MSGERTEDFDQAVDFYAVLQVREDADPEVIQAAYRRLTRKYNADAGDVGYGAEKLLELKAAYAVVGNATRRAEYDAAMGTAAEPALVHAGPPVAPGAPPAPEPYIGPPSGESVTDGPWVMWLEGAFPLIFASALIIVSIIGIYNAWRQIP